ncbi:MAG: hypothetical protein LBR15_08435 [Methanobrevibacter sp.]|jgi:hypothetical protein|nr:hypothetical protein [Candidatus Methanovirga australis]
MDSSSYNDSDTSKKDKKTLKSKNKHIEDSFSSDDKFKSCKGHHNQEDAGYDAVRDARSWYILFHAVMDSFKKPGMFLVLYPKSYKECIKGLIPGCTKVVIDYLPRQKVIQSNWMCCFGGQKEVYVDGNYLFFAHIRCKINGKWVGLNEYDPTIQELLRSFGFAVDRVKNPPASLLNKKNNKAGMS